MDVVSLGHQAGDQVGADEPAGPGHRHAPGRVRPAGVPPAAVGGHPPDTRRSPPTGGVGSSTVSSHRSGRWTGRGPLVWPRAMRSASGGKGREWSSPSRRASTSADRGGQSQVAPDLRTPPGTRSGTNRCACGTAGCRGPGRTGRTAGRGGPASSSRPHPGSGGRARARPGRRRPDHGTTRAVRGIRVRRRHRHSPLAPVIARASAASQRSPLPRTGMVVTASFSRPMASQSARARVELLGGPGVEGHGRRPFVLGRPARSRDR